MNIIETIGQLFGKRKRDRLIDLAAAARTIADGKTVDQEEICLLLEDAGKSPEDLQALVQRLLDRRELIRITALAEPVAARRTERDKKAIAIRKAFEDAKNAFNAGMEPLIQAEREDAQTEARAANARGQLYGHSPDIETQGKLEALQVRIDALNQRVNELQMPLKNALGALQKANVLAAHPTQHFNGMHEFTDAQKPVEANRRLKQAQEAFDGISSEIDELRRQAKELGDEQERVTEAAVMTA